MRCCDRLVKFEDGPLRPIVHALSKGAGPPFQAMQLCLVCVLLAEVELRRLLLHVTGSSISIDCYRQLPLRHQHWD